MQQIQFSSEFVGQEPPGTKTHRCFQVSLVGPIEGRGRVLEFFLKAHIESDRHSHGNICWRTQGNILKIPCQHLSTHRTEKHLVELISNSHSTNKHSVSSYLPPWSWQKGPLGGSPLRRLQWCPEGEPSRPWQVRLWRRFSWGHL